MPVVPSNHTLSFANREVAIYLVRGKENNRPVWHFISVRPFKRRIFETALAQDRIDLQEFGEVVASGYGQDPPPQILAGIKHRFALK